MDQTRSPADILRDIVKSNCGKVIDQTQAFATDVGHGTREEDTWRMSLSSNVILISLICSGAVLRISHVLSVLTKLKTNRSTSSS